MKKQYIRPEAKVFLIETTEIIATSVEMDLGGPADQEWSDAATYRTNLWD